MIQVTIRNTKEGIFYNFPLGYIANIVNALVSFSLSASIALAKILNDEDLANSLIQAISNRLSGFIRLRPHSLTFKYSTLVKW